MKYFLDTEFIEGFYKPRFGKRRHFIDLISIGIVCEDGRTYHAISKEYRYKDASEWVRENVIRKYYTNTVSGDIRNHVSAKDFQLLFGKPNKEIVEDVLAFFGCYRDQLFFRAPDGIEVYGYFADYDWVLFCSLFGRMIDLPKGFPFYCRDLKQTMDDKGLTKEWKQENCPDPIGEHNALVDAKWNYELFKKLNSIPERTSVVTQQTPNQGDEAGNQNPSQLKGATILSAEQILKKHIPELKHFFTYHQRKLVVEAMEEYKNQEVQLLNK